MADNKEVVRRFVDEVSAKGNLDYADQAITEDYVCHDPLAGSTGIGEYKAQTQKLFDAFPEGRFEQYELFGEGDLCAVRWRLTAKHEKPLFGIEASGKKVHLDGMSIFRLENGKIAEEWDHYDALGMLRQMGVTDLERFEQPSASSKGRQVEAQPQV